MMTLTTRTHTVIESPLGPLTVVADDGVLSGLYLPDHVRGPGLERLGDPDEEGFDEIKMQLAEYFAGTRTAFTVPVAPAGTPFQQSVWRELMSIPYGQTRSYGQLAHALGGPHLTRAVGAANGRNPISIVVPCHRVVGSDGSLTGYAGGLPRKWFLLDLEARQR
jgi:methylated-DNA-[protein]-cysteine S-methyltransferase